MTGIPSLAVLALCAAVAAACGDASDERGGSGLGPPPLYPLPGCEQFDLRPCDARENDCQLRLFETAGCLRGDDPGEPPPIKLLTTADYEEYLRARYLEDPPEDTTSLEHTLALFGLSDEGSYDVEQEIARAVEFLWGVYVRATREVWLIDRGAPFDGVSVNAVLVHEFVHALQDRAVDLGAFYEANASTYDSQLAIAAMIEGEADLVRYRYLGAALGLDPAEVELTKVFQSGVTDRWEALRDSPAALASSRMMFAYDYGARYLSHVFEAGGLRAVSDAWASPPITTHAFLSSQSGVVEPDFEPAELEAPTSDDDVAPTFELTLGAWGLFVLLAKHGATFETATDSALAWRGDRYFSYERGSAAGALWRIEFADERTAKEVATLLFRSGLSALASSTTLTLGVSDPSMSMDWAFDP